MYPYVKRASDVAVSFVMLVVLSPLLAVVAVLIKLESRGPVIFRQERIGKDGKVFEIYKFRSMCVGAESMGSGQYSFRGDTRITRVGKVIRTLSIDELPQLVNIIKGEMSLIGPRPVLTYHPKQLAEYSAEQKERFSVRPGVTGLAQVKGRKTLNWDERIEYDVYYVKHLSFVLDTKIFFETIAKVITASDNQNTGETSGNSAKRGKVENVEINVHNK